MDCKNSIYIEDIPAILYGESSENLYLYIHGQGGCKEEAERFADVACRCGWQVLSIDLPEHGERKNEVVTFTPWHVVPELSSIMKYVRGRWEHISLFANSIGAWFSMLAFNDEKLETALFVSPVPDMEQLLSTMMMWADVTEKQLEDELTIPTSFGQTLSWEYWLYVKYHPVTKWNVPTKILYGEYDNLTDKNTIDKFVHQFGCSLTVMESGEHWFHTPEQLDFLQQWTAVSLV